MLALEPLLARLAAHERCADRTMVASLLAHLDAAPTARSISLYTSSSAQVPSAAGLSWCAAPAEGGGAGHAGQRAPEPTAHVRAAKRAVNAVLAALQGRRAGGPVRVAREREAAAATGARATPATRCRTRADAGAAFSSAVAAPAPADDVRARIDCFRIAMATLVRAGEPQATLLPVAVAVARALIDVEEYSAALTELCALAACVDASTPPVPSAVAAPPLPAERLACALAYAPAAAVRPLAPCIVDAQAAALQAALRLCALDAVAAVHALWRGPHGPSAWQAVARADGCADAADRAACAMEREIFPFLDRVQGHYADALALSMDTMAALLPVAGVNARAFRQRLGRIRATAERHVPVEVLEREFARTHLDKGDATPGIFASACRAAETLASPTSPSSGGSTTSALLDLLQSATHALARGAQDARPVAEACVAAVERAHCGGQERKEERNAQGALLAIQSLRALALDAFDASAGTHDAALAFLARADALARTGSERHHLASVYVHLGSRLYARDAYASSAHFFARACDAEACAIATEEATHAAAAPLAAWRTALARACQVLGSAYQHMSQFQRAYDAFWRGIAASSAALVAAGARAAEMPLSDAFAPADAAQVGAMLRAALQLSVFCLLRPEDAAHGTTACALEGLRLPAAARAAALEYAAASLEPMLPRSGAPDAYRALLVAAVRAYEPQAHPVRYGRVRVTLAMAGVVGGWGEPDGGGTEERGTEAEGRRGRAEESDSVVGQPNDALAGRRGTGGEEVNGARDNDNGTWQPVDTPSSLPSALLSPTPALSRDAGLAPHLPALLCTDAAVQVLRSVRTADAHVDAPQEALRVAEDAARAVCTHLDEMRAAAVAERKARPGGAHRDEMRATTVAGRPARPRSARTATPPSAPRSRSRRPPASPISSPPPRDNMGTPGTLPPCPASPPPLLHGCVDALLHAGLLDAAVGVMRGLRALGDDAMCARLTDVRRSAGLPPSPDDVPAACAPRVRAHALLSAALAHAGYDARTAQQRYAEGVAAAQQGADKVPHWLRVLEKGEQYEMQAHAASAYAAVAAHHGTYAHAVAAALHAVRMRLRGTLLLGSTHARGGGPSRDVFGPPLAERRPAARAFPSMALAALHWRTVDGLLAAYLALSQLYAARGAARDALVFAHEGVDLAASLPAPTARAAAAAWRADLHAALGLHAKAAADRAAAHAAVGAGAGAGAGALRAYVAVLDACAQNDAAAYTAAERVLHDAAAACVALASHRGAAPPPEAPALAALRARLAAAALHGHPSAASARAALAALAPVPRTGAPLAPLHAALARAQLADAEALLRADPVWGALPEVARSVPGLATQAPMPRSRAALARRVRPLLEAALASVVDALAAGASDTGVVRDALQTYRAVAVLQLLVRARDGGEAGAAHFVQMLTNAIASLRHAAEHSLHSDTHPAAYAAGAPALAGLPRAWSAVHVGLATDRRTLIVARCGGGYETSVHLLPIDRQCRRDGDEETLTVDAALAELRGIVAASNAGVQGAKDVSALDARKAWWTTRHALDTELAQLLQSVQETWLGAFQGLFATLPCAAEPAFSALRRDVERHMQRACLAARAPPPPPLPPTSLACLAALPVTCRDEDLEDWAHYVMDAYQLADVPVAQDEVDMDEVCMDLRASLDEYRGRLARVAPAGRAPAGDTAPSDARGGAPDPPPHLFLILERELGELPWESLPVLRGRSVSRLPALEFLQGDTDVRRADAPQPGAVPRPTQPPPLLDPARTTYLLNPGGDLTRSEERFGAWLRTRAWRGTIGHAPVVDEVPQALAANDTFLYFGHSSGEMYLPASRLRQLSRCAAAMLWGCSSGAMPSQGEFDPFGTPHHYLLAHSPAVVANLWDTTDRELDSVCDGVLRGVGLKDDAAAPSSGAARGSGALLPLPLAVARARDMCKLPYLTGAACVVYGVPITWRAAPASAQATETA
ncbi:separase [Malassezia sp. CBS 17886]|nr:separase [Malassezia sp. CBS 17886]